MNSFAGLYTIRPYSPDDEAFVLATFLNGMYYGDSWFSIIPKAIFMVNYRKVAQAMVSGKATVNVACLPDDQSVILGYSILSHDFKTIHYVFVKDKWRKMGIARSLLPKDPVAATHLTRLGRKLMHKFNDLIFDPFRL